MNERLEELKRAIVEGEDDIAREIANAALIDGLVPLDLINQAIVPGIQEVGKLWNDSKYFLPDVILSAGAFQAALDIVEPKLAEGAGKTGVKILFGVVSGDMHDLGKTIVIAMLKGAGFDVIDLGVDVAVQTFVEKARELKPDIICLGAYMTTTMLSMKDVIDALHESGLRGRIKVIIGGVPTSQQFCDEIGSDAWGEDALDAVDKVKQLMGVNNGSI